jgi:hypothetical protein
VQAVDLVVEGTHVSTPAAVAQVNGGAKTPAKSAKKKAKVADVEGAEAAKPQRRKSMAASGARKESKSDSRRLSA